MENDLQLYGLTDCIEQEAALYGELFLARVTEQHRTIYKVISGLGEVNAVVAGKLAYQANGQISYPAVGDWVMLDRGDGEEGNAVIRHILSRKSVLARQAAGAAAAQQVIAANIDVIFICMSLNADFNLRRIERYLAMAWNSGAAPVIVLTKAELCNDLPQKLGDIAAVGIGVDIIACSSENGYGYEAIHSHIGPGKTIAFIGSSGVGKSTLINRLLGRELLATGEIRLDDDKGRHTTSHRQLLLLPEGGIVIDTPGMRELQLYTGDLARTFADIEELAARCKYRDCSHGSEPGCAIKAAIASGALSAKRFESYQKLQRETSYDGLNARQLETEKINRMFGGKNEMKQMLRQFKEKNRR